MMMSSATSASRSAAPATARATAGQSGRHLAAAPPADEAFGSVLVIGGRGLPGFRKLPGPLDLPDQRALDSGTSHLL